jgi:protein tyrosine phosphatase (PTP) superfamily phosphohydrolase (DUF442 family)
MGISGEEINALSKIPHHIVEVAGGCVVFYCKNGAKKYLFYSIANTNEFWGQVGSNTEVQEIEKAWNVDKSFIPYCSRCIKCREGGGDK